ncbi:MAG: exodeoxyribonuclease VII large subunit [Candidatus Micrarchaeota archaeon]
MNKFLLAALFFAATGTLFLFYFSQEQPVLIKNISEITERDYGFLVQASGFVSGFRKTKNNVFFDLCYSQDCIKTVMFQRVARTFESVSLKNGDFVLVKARVQEYEGELELVIEALE